MPDDPGAPSRAPSREPPAAPAPPPATRLPALPRSERGVERADALTRYMAELSKHPPISREEEHALAVRWIEQRDLDAARRLVLANLRLVVKIAMEYRRAWTNVLDLIQEGNVGLLQATHRFDPYQGVKLSSYAAYWIRAYILKYILDNFRVVRLGTTRAQRKLFFRLNKEKRELEREGFQVEPRLLAERLQVAEGDVVDMEQRLSQADLSLNAPVRRDGDGAEFGDFLASRGASAEDDVGSAQLREVFQRKLSEFSRTLPERDRQIVEQRVLADEPRTLQELADEFGVSRERVRQLEARIVGRLREYLKQNLVDFEYYASPKD
jgi:RNA polymerase sigma-32 factor